MTPDFFPTTHGDGENSRFPLQPPFSWSSVSPIVFDRTMLNDTMQSQFWMLLAPMHRMLMWISALQNAPLLFRDHLVLFHFGPFFENFFISCNGLLKRREAFFHTSSHRCLSFDAIETSAITCSLSSVFEYLQLSLLFFRYKNGSSTSAMEAKYYLNVTFSLF